MLSLTPISALALAPQLAVAYPGFVGQIPNAQNLPASCDMCHNSAGGGDARNVFGRTVEMHQDGINVDWPSVCAVDSDGDGLTNGEELADPDCIWGRGDAYPEGEISDPRDATSPGMMPAGGEMMPFASCEDGISNADEVGVDCGGVCEPCEEMLSVSDEPEGANCAHGGSRVETGVDYSNNGVLDADEVEQTTFVCNGTPGTDGISTVVVTDDLVGTECDAFGNGGTRVRTGLDNGDAMGIAGDGILQDGEVDATTYVCNGAHGADGQNGVPGQDGMTGVDGENGRDGADGANGANGVDGRDGAAAQQILVKTSTEDSSDACAFGAVRIETGVDSDDDGVLSEAEVTDTQRVCNGQPGAPGKDGDSGCSVNGFESGPLSPILAMLTILGVAGVRRRRFL